jgi:hypothetical protein
MKKSPTQKSKKIKSFLAARAVLSSQGLCFWGITPKPTIRMLQKLDRLEVSTKPHVHQKFEIFWTSIAFTMACSNFKNGPKNVPRFLGG